MRRRDFLATLSTSALAQPRGKRPNIVMIFCDDLGYGDLGCYGNRVIHTPHLDALARRGARFTDFYSMSPVCTPSRTALMTGQYPQRFGIHHADVPESAPRYWLPASALTIAELLKRNGYATAHIGKWHLGEPPDTVAPREQGFDYFFGGFGGRPSSSWIKYARSMNPEMIRNEERPRVYPGHVTEVQTADALGWLDENGRGERPFFLNLWYNAPHEPLDPIAHQAKLYRDWSPEEQTYFQTVTDMDAAVGRVMAKLKEIGDNTLIVFSSDNGPEAHRFRYSRGSAGPLKGMKTQLWEGGIRVPGIMVWPGVIPPGVRTEAACTLDLFPTFAAAGQAAIPAEHKLDGGVNLAPVLERRARMPDRAVVWEFHSPQRGVEASLPMAVRRGRWKLFSDFEFRQQQLYDLGADVAETTDVSASNPVVAARLVRVLRAWHTEFAPKLDLGRARTPVPTPSPEELDKRHYRN